MLTGPVQPVGHRRATPDDRRRPWAIILSVLLHLVALAFLLTARRAEPPVPDTPSYDLMFENGGSSVLPAAPDQAVGAPAEAPAPDLPISPPPEPARSEKPTEQLPEPVPTPMVQPGPTPETAPDPEAKEPLSKAQPTPPPETAPAPEPPAVRLAEPRPATEPISPQALAPELPPMVPPPPLPPAPLQPRQQALQRPPPGGFPPPIDLNFGPAASRAPTPQIGRSSRAIDLSLGAPKPAPNKNEPFFNIRSANVGADWLQTVRRYMALHSYYPRQAVENNEQGVVEIDFVVNRQGRVTSVEITGRSGSPWLDMATLAMFRNAQLAPLPFEDPDPTATIHLTFTYALIR